MTTKTYISRTTYKLASGEVRVHEATRQYTISGAYIIPDETKKEILRRAAVGAPATRIARDIGIGVTRVRRVIKRAAAEVVDDVADGE